MIPKLHIYQQLPSTNRTALELGTFGALHGEVVWAGSQTAGRGRLGKSWNSPAGKGLYFSIIVRPHLSRDDYAKLTMTTGLAVALSLEQSGVGPFFLKWPNDIMVSGRKCGGILCESSFGSEPSSDFAVLGIGLNADMKAEDFPEEIRGTATSLFIESGKQFDFEELLKAITDEVLRQIVRLETRGFTEILAGWKDRDFLKGKWLNWLTDKGEVVLGKACGVNQHGLLRIVDELGKQHFVISGDISLAGRLQ